MMVRWIVMMGLVLSVFGMITEPALAQTATCNTDEQLAFSEDGIISPVVAEIQDILVDAYEDLYEGVLANDSFIGAIQAGLVLYVLISGILFTLGIVQLSAGELFVRVFKIALISILIGPGGQAFFHDYVYTFFRDGADFIIASMTGIMAQVLADPTAEITTLDVEAGALSSGPFVAMDAFITQVFSPQTIPIFQAALNQSEYGPSFFTLYLIMCFYLLGTVAKSLWIYLVSLLALSLLFGLAPIFVACLMFQRTRNLFDGWLGQCINFTLQPVLCFTFITFFVILMSFSMTEIFDMEVCYCETTAVTGVSQELNYWAFTEDDVCLSLDYSHKGPLWAGEPITDMDVFPIEIAELLSALLLAYIGYNFIPYAVQLSNDISGAWIQADTGSPVTKAIDFVGGKASNAAGQLVAGNSLGQVLGFDSGSSGSGRAHGGGPPPSRFGTPGRGSNAHQTTTTSSAETPTGHDVIRDTHAPE